MTAASGFVVGPRGESQPVPVVVDPLVPPVVSYGSARKQVAS